jgi:hypothetical protein
VTNHVTQQRQETRYFPGSKSVSRLKADRGDEKFHRDNKRFSATVMKAAIGVVILKTGVNTNVNTASAGQIALYLILQT